MNHFHLRPGKHRNNYRPISLNSYTLEMAQGLSSRSTLLAIAGILIILSTGCNRQLTQSDTPETGVKPSISDSAIIRDFSFNGYTTHWQDRYTRQVQYGNLIRFDAPDIRKTILQSKIDIATDLGLPGLKMQEGFLNTLATLPYTTLNDPTAQNLQTALEKGNVLVYVDSGSEGGQKLEAKRVSTVIQAGFPAHVYDAQDISLIRAYILDSENRKVMVVSTENEDDRRTIKKLIENTLEVIREYDLYKGWFGARTLLKSVTATPGHPVQVIGQGMDQGNSWFVFSGYMEFLAKDEIEKWTQEAGLDVVTDVGFSPIYGCRNYEGLQVQSMFTPEEWIDFASKKEGYVFRPVFDLHADSFNLDYDGYLASAGNKEQIDQEEIPFVLPTGNLLSGAIPSMVLFLKKDLPLTRSTMWEAILDRRAVGIEEGGLMMGPAHFRNALGMVVLDRIFLEDYLNDEVSIRATTDQYHLQIELHNNGDRVFSGNLDINLPKGLHLVDSLEGDITIHPGGVQIIILPLQPDLTSMDRSNAIGIKFDWNGGDKQTATLLKLPPVITANPALYGHAPRITYQATVHNYTSQPSFPVMLEVFESGGVDEPVFTSTKEGFARKGDFQTLTFDLELEPGHYVVRTSALNSQLETQMGVGEPKGHPSLVRSDLNGDGVDEYILENDSVRITLLTTGARVIDYTVKSREDNILFKLWPDKPIDDDNPYRKRRYYPYGGFEDFLGQPSIETHKVYSARVMNTPDDHVSVQMEADYFGSKIIKTFTLFGNSPLLEIRFNVMMAQPELNVFGPQPMLEIGQAHDLQDVFILPEMDGNKEYKMKPERYFGRIAYLREGWNAGYDSRENVSFVGAFPVDKPYFMHMWMNHPSNGGSHYYYVEFQPWIPIPPHSVLHFAYYIWGSGSDWADGLKALKARNLVITSKK